MTPQSRSIAGLLALIALAVLPYRDVPGMAITGADAPMLIEAALASAERIPPALIGPALGDPTLGISFYRPLTALTYALVHAVAGMRPAPQHLVDVSLHVGAVLLVFAVARRTLASTMPAALGAAVLALHPAGNEVVPDVARRADLLAAVLLLAACASQQRGRARAALGWAMLAPLAKETGFVTALPLLLWRWEHWRRERAAPWRSVPPARVWGPPLLVMLPALTLRTACLRGVGGYEQRSGPLRLAANAVDQLRLLVEPAEWLPVDVGRVVGLAVGAALVALMLRRARSRSLGIGAASIALGALGAMSVAGRFGWWHLYLPGVAFALSVAAAAAGGWPRETWRQGAALVAAAGVLLSLPASPLWGRCTEWGTASDVISRVQQAALALPQEPTPPLLAGLPSRVLTRPGPGARAHGADVATAPGLAAFLRLHGRAAPRLEALCFLNVPAQEPRAGLRVQLEGAGALRLQTSPPARIAIPTAAGGASGSDAGGSSVFWLSSPELRYRWKSPGYPIDIEFFAADEPTWIERRSVYVWDGAGFRRLGGRAR